MTSAMPPPPPSSPAVSHRLNDYDPRHVFTGTKAPPDEQRPRSHGKSKSAYPGTVSDVAPSENQRRPTLGKSKSHGRSPSLIGFDPLLSVDDVGHGVWSGSNNNGSAAAEHPHPLLSPTPAISPKPLRSQKPGTPPKSTSRSHRKSRSVDGLREIAHQLAMDKPRTNTTAEDIEQRAATSLFSKKKGSPIRRHRKSQSLGATDVAVAAVMNSQKGKDIGGLVSNSVPSTPEVSRLKGSSIVRLTPTRRTPQKKAEPQEQKVVDVDKLEIPTLTPFHGFLTASDNTAMRSSEQEPSLHQVEVPASEDFLMHSRLCAVMDQYRVVDQNFDFGTLVGTPRLALQGFVRGNDLDGLTRQHTPVIQSLLECSDDIMLEGFFHGDSDEVNNRVEVAVFNSQARRQFVVVYRGTSDQQIKPVRNREIRAAPTNLHPDHSVGVFPAFRDSYFRPDLEPRVFALLDRLSEQNPFCDVVMTGHSFGGALATIAAMRFATSREMMRVSCHAFGSPKVGGPSFKQLVNSLPNLKVMRVEQGNDPWVQAPESHSHAWVHVGHTLAVNPERKPAVVAYRFDKNKPVTNAIMALPHSLIGMGKNHKSHEILTYVKSMEQFARLGQAWVKSYVGEDVGKGVRGTDNEKRQMV